MQTRERDFFRIPVTRDEITDLPKGKSASEMLIVRSPSFRQLGLSRETPSDDNLVDLMVKDSRLIPIPIVGIGDDVYFGADKLVLDNRIP